MTAASPALAESQLGTSLVLRSKHRTSVTDPRKCLMSYKTILRIITVTVFVATAAAAINTSSAGFGLRCPLPDQTGCCCRCPACDHVCNLEAKVVDEEIPCFDVESKVICIPRVVFPWQKRKGHGSCDSCDGGGCSQCVHNGAKTRRICVLTTDKYKCPKCQYTWSAEKCPGGPGCDSSCDAGCDAGFASQRQPWSRSTTPQSPLPMVYRELSPTRPGTADAEVAVERLPAATK